MAAVYSLSSSYRVGAVPDLNPNFEKLFIHPVRGGVYTYNPCKGPLYTYTYIYMS